MTPFFFGIALTPRAAAVDWGRVEALLSLTLASVVAQSDGDFRVLVAGHDRPDVAGMADPRVEWLAVNWPVPSPGPGNDDSGRKKHLLNAAVRARGGGLFMLLDADDWIDRRLVAGARAAIGPRHVGGLIRSGFLVDFGRGRAAPVPHPAAWAGDFHRLCGSSTVAAIRPDDPDAARGDPFETLRSHHLWLERAAERGWPLAELPAPGAYLVNTAENHSELHGVHAEWRRELAATAARAGRDLGDDFLRRFGLSLPLLRAAGAAREAMPA